MSQKSPLRISIVIPVYNEAAHLAACLDAISLQKIKPYEVLVVDNNSSDESLAIARLFPFVKVLHESHQGVVHARNRGFNEAKGDILGRIDADTVVPVNWTETLQEIFSDDSIDATSGSVNYYDLPYGDLSASLDLLFRQQIANGMKEEVFLYGANMAIRKRLWLKVKKNVCNNAGIHEDFDLAIHSNQIGAKVTFDKRLHAGISLRRVDATVKEFWEYAMLSPRTYKLHNLKSQKHMYPVIILVICFYWLIRVLHMGYDPNTSGFSWSRLWRYASQARVNPATFVE